MASTGREASRLEADAVGMIERIQAEIAKLRSQIGMAAATGAIEISTVNTPIDLSLESITRPATTSIPTSEKGVANRVVMTGKSYVFLSGESAGAAQVDESEDSLTLGEIQEVFREALKLIDANGLDTPEAHLEYVRRQLRAAVA